jgi:hypothetical protein
MNWAEFHYWTMFLVATALGFGVYEWFVIATGQPEKTLSYKIREWLGIEPPKPWRFIASFLFAVGIAIFAVWFIAHIVFGFGI